MRCTHCQAPIPIEAVNTGTLVPCGRCGTRLRVDLFPAALSPGPTVQAGETLVSDQEAGCFYHPGKKAVTACDTCGRFLCALCDVELSGRHTCFSCLEREKHQTSNNSLDNHRTLYDGIALRLSVLPLLFFWITVITAPLSLFMVFRYWKAPTSIVGRTRIRFVLAAIFSSVQILAWSAGLYVLVT